MNNTPDKITILTRLLCEGNETAFHQLYNIYHQKIYSFSYSLTRSTALAEDITQEIFIKVWIGRSKLSDIDHLENWLRVLARNHAYNYLKRMAMEKLILKNLQAAENMPGASPEENLTIKEYNLLVRKAVDLLPPQQKKVYILNRLEGLKADEIACELGLSTNTIKGHIKAALSSIRAFCKARIAGVLFFW